MTTRTWQPIRRSAPATQRPGVPDNTVTYGAWKTTDNDLWITIYRTYRGDPSETHYVVVENGNVVDISEHESFVAAEAEVEARKTQPALA